MSAEAATPPLVTLSTLGSVMKNSEVLPSGPSLAMASRPLEVKRKSAFNSSGIALIGVPE